MLENPYWSRVRIVQEIMVSRQVDVLYGGRWFDWALFSSIIGALNTDSPTGVAADVGPVRGYGNSSVRSDPPNTGHREAAGGLPARHQVVNALCLGLFHHAQATLGLDGIFAFQEISTAVKDKSPGAGSRTRCFQGDRRTLSLAQPRWEAFGRTCLGDKSLASYPADAVHGDYLKAFMLEGADAFFNFCPVRRNPWRGELATRPVPWRRQRTRSAPWRKSCPSPQNWAASATTLLQSFSTILRRCSGSGHRSAVLGAQGAPRQAPQGRGERYE